LFVLACLKNQGYLMISAFVSLLFINGISSTDALKLVFKGEMSEFVGD